MLEDLYGAPRRLSQILNSQELSQEQIEELKKHRLTAFLNLLTSQIKTFWKAEMSWRDDFLLRAKYPLSGRPPRQTLAKQYHLSEQQIDAITAQALRHLRSKKLLAQFELLAVRCAREVLDST